MKDIGKSRRKGKRNNQITLQFFDDESKGFARAHQKPGNRTLEASVKPQTLPEKKAHTDLAFAQSKSEPFTQFPDSSLLQPWSYLDGLHATKGADNNEDSSFLYPRLEQQIWTGRMDPFVRYPIELNDRTRELVDLGKICPPSC